MRPGGASRDAVQRDPPVLGLDHLPAVALAACGAACSRVSGVVLHDQHGAGRGGTGRQDGYQPVAVDGLGEVVGRAQRIAQVPSSTIVSMMTGMSATSGSRLERSQHRPAVHARHQHVEGDDVGLQLAAPAAGPPRRRRAVTTRKPSLGRKRSHQLAHGGVVVDDEHGAPR